MTLLGRVRLSVTMTLALAGILWLTGCGSGNGNDAVPLANAGAKTVYVVLESPGPWSVLEFPAAANGNVAPISTLTLPAGLVVDTITTDNSGQLSVALRPVSLNVGVGEVAVYAAGANGTATPLRTILGSSTTGTGSFLQPIAPTVDSTGALYVMDNTSDTLSVFSSTANGVATPLRSLYGPLTQFNGSPPNFAVDKSANLYINTQANILVFPPTANGNVAPTRTLAGAFGPIRVDAAGNLYVLDNPVYSVIRVYDSVTGAPLRTISAPDQRKNPSLPMTYIIEDFQVDAAGNIYFTGEASTCTGHGCADIPALVVGSFGAGAADPPNLGYVTPTTVMSSDSWTRPDGQFLLALK